MEIVSEPDLRSPDEARDYAMTLQTLLRAIGASDADMEKGQMRAEPNVSIRRAGTEELGVKTELKNINSFSALHRAIAYEVRRQAELIESGGTVVQETRGWSEAGKRTFSQRSKEFAEDYRYFPEPDLPPLELDRAWIESLRAALPELPGVRRARLIAEYALSSSDAAQIALDRTLADLFEGAASAGADAKQTANWIIGVVAPNGLKPTADQLAAVVKLVSSRSITRDDGREVLAESVRTGRQAAEIVADRGYTQVSDTSVLEPIAREVIEANPKAVADYRAGKQAAIGPLVGALRKRAPEADSTVANELLRRLLG
jgi:aspartyl-tRNA(Asn)/glutamyl-tRNA(Gln) amidotransferase subunit B